MGPAWKVASTSVPGPCRTWGIVRARSTSPQGAWDSCRPPGWPARSTTPPALRASWSPPELAASRPLRERDHGERGRVQPRPVKLRRRQRVLTRVLRGHCGHVQRPARTPRAALPTGAQARAPQPRRAGDPSWAWTSPAMAKSLRVQADSRGRGETARRAPPGPSSRQPLRWRASSKTRWKSSLGRLLGRGNLAGRCTVFVLDLDRRLGGEVHVALGANARGVGHNFRVHGTDVGRLAGAS